MAHEIIPEFDLAKFNGTVARELAERSREAHMVAADDTANYAIALHPLITATLRKFGIDGNTNRFGFGAGLASKNASAVIAALKKAADADENAAAHWSAFHRLYMEKVDAPIEEAKRQASHGNTLDY